MKATQKFVAFLLVLTLMLTSSCFSGVIPVNASWTEYTAWSDWSGWQDDYISGNDLREVDTRSVYVSTTYHYYRYSTARTGGSGSYAQSSSYPTYFQYDFDSPLTETDTSYGRTRYHYWYSSSNWTGVYACDPYTTDNYKTQYRYRTRSIITYYTISYNANGGGGAPGNQTKQQNVALTLTTATPSTPKSYTITYNANGGSVSETSKKVNCSFSTWNTAANGSGTTYNKGASFSSNADTTLYAQWTNPKAVLPSSAPTWTGHTFKGWFTAASGGSQVTTSTTITQNTTIYAQWTTDTYTVSYNANGGSGAPANQTKTYGVDLTLTTSTPTTPKSYTITYNANGGSVSSSSKTVNCTFANWNTKADGSGTTYAKGGTYKGNSAVTLYAQWTDPNAGDLLTPTRATYVFDGWFTAQTGGAQVTSTTKITQNTTLYAHWTLNEYTVSYNANGGSGAPASQQKIHGEVLTLTSSVPSTAKKYTITYNANGSGATVSPTSKSVDCTFNNWNTKADGTGTSYSKGGSYTDNAAVTLYAQWTNPTYGTLATPTRTGYTFGGWYTAASDGTKIETSATVTGNVTIYAHWTANKYTIQFDANGGTVTPTSKQYTFGGTYGSLPTATRAGYYFDGWFTAKTGGTQVTKSSTVAAQNMTLYAHWTAKPVESIAVDLSSTTTTYYVGDTFDPTKVAIVVTYEDGETQKITSGFTCSQPVLNKETQKRVTVEYKEKTAYFTIDIVNAPLTSISVETLPAKVEYFVGDSLNADGIVVTAAYQNGYTQAVTDGLTYSYTFDQSGTKSVTVSYTEKQITKTASFQVTVLETPKIYADPITGYCGETVTIPVKIADNHGLMGVGLDVSYDSSMMAPVSVSQGSIISGSLNDSISTSTGNSFKIVWAGTDNVTTDGVLFNIQFAVAGNAYGDYSIDLSYDEDNTFDAEWQSVKLDCQDITVSISDRSGSIPKILTDNYTAMTGSVLEVPFRIVNNTSINATTVSIEYDSTALKPVSVAGTSATIVSSNVASANGTLTVSLNNIPKNTGTADLFTVCFEVQYCTLGEYTLTITNIDAIKCENASVKVVKGHASMHAGNVQISGDSLTVPVHIQGNTGIMGFKVNFEYDAAVLTPVSASAGAAFSSGMMENNIASASAGCFSVIWVGNDNITVDGECIVLRFQIKNPITTKTQISMSFSQPDTYDSDWNDVELQFRNIDISAVRTITFNANGGNCSTATSIVTYGDTYGELPDATRQGYTFAGWFTSASGGAQIQNTTLVTITADQTLYAHWTINQYTIQFVNEDGTVLQTGKWDYNATPTYSGETPTKTATAQYTFTFSGWTPTVARVTEDATYTATYSSTVNQYTVAFKNDNGTVLQTGKWDYNTTPTYNGETPTKAATAQYTYTFAGWTPAIAKVTKNATYTATYTSTVNQYAVFFDAMGGTCYTANQTVTYGESYGSLPIPTRVGYSFEGWFTETNGGEQITQDTVVELSDNQTLYAHWTAITVTIMFDANGGSCDTEEKSVIFDSAYGNLPVATKYGYDFVGWFTAAEDGTMINSDSVVSVAESQTLYARFAAKTIIVTLDATEGSCGTETLSVIFDDVYGALPVAEKEGHSFLGWYTEEEAGEQITDVSVVANAENHTLYAHWEEVEQRISGDASGDGVIDLKDVVMLRRYLTGGWDVTVDLSNSDVNADGVVDLKDVVILRRYLSGGWDVTLK